MLVTNAAPVTSKYWTFRVKWSEVCLCVCVSVCVCADLCIADLCSVVSNGQSREKGAT